MKRNQRGEIGILSTFLIALAAITAGYFIYYSSVSAINDGYGTTNDLSSISSLNTMSSVQNITDDLETQFTGQNSSTSSSGVLGDSFNQVYTLGIVTTRIISTVTPGIFSDIMVSIGGVLGVDPALVSLSVFVITLILIGGLLAVLLGRLL